MFRITVTLLLGLFIGISNSLYAQETRFTCHSKLIYELKSESTISGHAQPIIMQAQLEQMPLLMTQEGTLVKNTVKAAHFTGLLPQQSVELTRQVNRNIYVLYNEHGGVKALYGQIKTPISDYNAIKPLVLSNQIVLSPNQQNGIIKEKDDKGIAIVEYSKKSPNVLQKQRKSYEKFWSDGIPLNITASNIQIHFNKTGMLEKMDLIENMSVGAVENPFMTTRLHQSLILQEIQKIAQKNVQLCIHSSLENIIQTQKLIELPFQHIVDKEKQKFAKRESLKNVDLEHLLSKLKSEKFNEWIKAFNLLVDLLSYYPEKLPKMLSLIENHINDKGLVKSIISAIAYANCSEAQPTLLKIMQYFHNQVFILRQAIVEHHFVPLPAQENIDYLIAFYKNTDNQKLKKLTLLALGSLAKKVDAIKLETQSHPITEFLLVELRQAKNNQERLTVFEALGNTGDIVAFDTLKNMVASRDVNISSWAIAAMRQMPSNKVKTELLAILKKSHNDNHQLAALRALQDRKLSNDMIQMIINRYLDFNMIVRLEVLSLLSQPQLIKNTAVSQFFQKLHSDKALSEAERKK